MTFYLRSLLREGHARVFVEQGIADIEVRDAQLEIRMQRDPVQISRVWCGGARPLNDDDK